MVRAMCPRVLLLLGLLAACGGPPAQAPTAPPDGTVVASAPVEPECTLETPLVPGVPGSPGHLVPTEVNPNGQSELALVMRTMQEDMKAAREAIAAGRPVGHLVVRHRKMRCAWPTTPSDRNPTFDAFAVGYLAAADALEKHPDAATFDAVLNTCKACHEQSCPGPVAAIEALRMGP